ncbi:hypothetical protein [Paraburkholderia sp. BR14320]|uniref:hypothetical protein n=1 Tax=unclassified Paraburkholderia TaxID=2615204 RepID=UPI0034CFBB3C
MHANARTTLLLGRLLCSIVFVLLALSTFSKPAQPLTPPSDRCRSPHGLSEAEQSAWTDICARALLPMRHSCDDNAPTMGHRFNVRANFIRMVLSASPYKDIFDTQHAADFVNIDVEGDLDLSRLELPTLLFDSVAVGSVNLDKSNIKGDVEFCKSDVWNSIRAVQARVSGNFGVVGYKEVRSRSYPHINIDGSEIGGMIYINNIVVGGFDLSGSAVAKSVRSTNATFYFFRIEESEINSSLVLTDVRIFHPHPSSGDCRTGYDNDDDTRIRLARVGQELRFENVELNTRLVLVDTTVRTNVLLDGSKLRDVCAMNLTVQGLLQFWGTNWADNSRLDLRYASVGRFLSAYSPSAWPPMIVLTGLSFGAFDPLHDPRDQLAPEKWFPLWLERGTPKFQAQPYQEAIRFLKNAGLDEAAVEVGYQAKDRQRNAACAARNFSDCIILTLSKKLVGYGFRLWYSLIWSFVFVFIGSFVFFNTHEIGPPRLSNHRPNTRGRAVWAIIYSFDMLLPIVKLKDSNYDVDIASKAQYYLYFHKLMGWILGTFILAGLTGWTRSI